MERIRLEPCQIVSEVVKLLGVNQVQEIIIWSDDTDVRFLDGTTINYKWGCDPYRMKELAEELEKSIPELEYWTHFSGFNVSWECVRIQLKEESEIWQKYSQTLEPDDEDLHEKYWIINKYFHR